MATDKPNPQHFALRFKQHKITILLFVKPHDPLTSVKEKLLAAIKDRNISQIDGRSLPSDPQDIIFGVPIDKHDPSQGWVGLDIPGLDDDERKKGGKKPSVLNATPIGAGLKDGSLLAFKFKQDGSGGDDVDMNDNEFNVIMPSFDDEVESQAKEVGEG
ncbi:MAG: hypothetical protein Q9220_002532 [cf. Caloplaca sp. 1 TL-2023]